MSNPISSIGVFPSYGLTRPEDKLPKKSPKNDICTAYFPYRLFARFWVTWCPPPPTTPVNNSSNNSDGNNNNNWPHHFDRNKNNPMHSGGYFLSTIEIRRLEQPKWTTESCHNRMQLIKTNLNEKHSMKWRKKGIDQVTQWRHFTAISFPPFPAIFLRFSSFHHFLLS